VSPDEAAGMTLTLAQAALDGDFAAAEGLDAAELTLMLGSAVGLMVTAASWAPGGAAGFLARARQLNLARLAAAPDSETPRP
jgi:hypothetical protein